MNELKLPEPDTHCLDDEGGRPIDVWSYSPQLVQEILAQQQAEIERLKADAARYRWLKKNPQWLGWEHDFRPDEVEREVDAAMKETP